MTAHADTCSVAHISPCTCFFFTALDSIAQSLNMYASKFVPQDKALAAAIAAEHDYCAQQQKQQEKNKNEKKRKPKKQTKDSEKKRKDSEIEREDSEKENPSSSSSDCDLNLNSNEKCVYDFVAEEDCDTFQISEEQQQQQDVEECHAVQVNAIDSGISADEYVRVAGTAIGYEIFPGLRRTSNVLCTNDESHLYVKNSTSTIGEGWKCYFAKDGCLARVHVLDGKCSIANSEQHSHSQPSQLIVNMRALNEIKSILRSVNNRSKPREVFDEVVKR